MKILVDMNLPPSWCGVLQSHGWPSVHWSNVGPVDATDHDIMAWAAQNDHIVFTHDLDFGMILATSLADGPSVIQLRSQDVVPSAVESIVVSALKAHEAHLVTGALIVIDRSRARVRILPLK